PRPALAALDQVAADQRLVPYQPYWAARADILARLGRRDAAEAYEPALGLTTDEATRCFLVQRCAAVRSRVSAFARTCPIPRPIPRTGASRRPSTNLAT